MNNEKINNEQKKDENALKENVGKIKSFIIIGEIVIIIILCIVLAIKSSTSRCEVCKPCTLENYELYKNYDNLRLSLMGRDIKINEKENILSNEKNTLFFNHENRSMKINIVEKSLVLYSQDEIILTTDVSTDNEEELNYSLYIDGNVIMIINKKNDKTSKVDFLLYNSETKNYGHTVYETNEIANPIFTDNGIYFGVISEGARSNATNGSVVNIYLLNTKENKITYEYNIDYNDINHSEENK